MVFLCSLIYKYDALTASDDLKSKMSVEQLDVYVVPQLLLSVILIVGVIGSLVFAGVLVFVQFVVEVTQQKKLRRLKYAATGQWVVCKQLEDPQAFHLFLRSVAVASNGRQRLSSV